MVVHMWKKITVFCVSDIICMIYSLLLQEQLLFLFTLLFPLYVFGVNKYCEYSNTINTQNVERNSNIKNIFFTIMTMQVMIMSIGAVIDYYFHISEINDDLFTLIVLIPIVVSAIYFFYKLSKLPAKK